MEACLHGRCHELMIDTGVTEKNIYPSLYVPLPNLKLLILMFKISCNLFVKHLRALIVSYHCQVASVTSPAAKSLQSVMIMLAVLFLTRCYSLYKICFN